MTHASGARSPRRRQLDPAGLTQTIKLMVDEVAASSPTRFDARLTSVDGLFSPDAATIIARLLQECLNNVVQHAQATEATLTVDRQPASVIFSVHDNGRGFDAHASERARQAGFGLSGLADGVQTLGGALSIASLPGEGTTITIILDVPETPDVSSAPSA